MRGALLSAAALVMAVGVSPSAEARGFRLRAWRAPATRVTIVPAISLASAAAPAALAAPAAQSRPPANPVSAPSPQETTAQAAAKPWCPTNLFAGTGSGFCLVN